MNKQYERIISLSTPANVILMKTLERVLFVIGPNGKRKCAVCVTLLSNNKRFDCNRHYMPQHEEEIEGKQKFMRGKELSKNYIENESDVGSTE
jgi:hypothetical protein